MNRERKDALRQILEAERDKILASIKTLATNAKEDENATADAMIECFGQTLDRITAAQDRLEIDRYGFCSEPKCRKEIDEQRLTALPFAVRCTSCEKKHEYYQRLHRQEIHKGELHPSLGW